MPSEIHYFQRYSQRENVATNNTLLLFSRLYNESIHKFNVFINELLGEESVSVGIKFSQQSKSSSSVPDGIMEQSSFIVVIETKLGSGKNFSKKQLLNHFTSFKNEEKKILIALSPTKMGEKLFKEISDECNLKEYSINFINITFRDIVKAFNTSINDYDFQLKEIIDDYQSYCFSEKLINDEEFRIKIIPCGGSYELNMKYGAYYMPSNRGTSEHTYIGVYTNKAVIGIGKIVNEIDVEFINGEPIINRKKYEVTKEQENIIIDMEKETREKIGWDLSLCEHKFYIVEKFYETNYKKDSPGGIQGHRYYNLKEVLGVEELPKLDIIAEKLKQLIWK